MSLASSEKHSVRHARIIPFHGRRREAAGERISDCWPDFSSTMPEARLRTSFRKNRAGRVLAEAVGAVAYSVGLVILLMIIVKLVGKA